jgi:hypothetical protein
MADKRTGILFILLILFCILTTGFYDQVFDENNFSEKIQTLKDGCDDLDHSICKIKELWGVIHSEQTLRPITGFYFHEILEKASLESYAFLSFFTYRAPPIRF